jgi:hypothetical protein
MNPITDDLRPSDEHAFGSRVERHGRGLHDLFTQFNLPAALGAEVGPR